MSRVTMAALAWALIHFVWQGAAIALVAGFAVVALRRARPAVRYVVLCGALGAMLLAPAVTTLVLLFPRAPVPVQTLAAPLVARSSPVAPVAGLPTRPSFEESAWLDWIVEIWLAGVLVLGTRSLGGWVWAQRLRRRGTTPPPTYAMRVVLDLRERLGIRRAVRVLSTAIAEVPTTVGWLRPVILVPVSALTALTTEQLELLIAHELAHVRRHDYLVNLAQTAVETVLFYHPAVWWVSAKIRAERENCTDDLAVAACGDVTRYVKALAALEGLRAKRPGVAIAADGGSLLRRIDRLAGAGRAEREMPPAWLGALATAALIFAAALSAPAPRAAAPPPPPPASEPPPKPAPEPPPPPPAARAAPKVKAPPPPPRGAAPSAKSAEQPPPPPRGAAPSPESAAALPPPPPAAEPPSRPAAPPPPPPAAPPAALPGSRPAAPSESKSAPEPPPRPPAAPPEPKSAAPPPPPPAAPQEPKPKAARAGFLGELSASGYRKLSVDEIIALREHGVEPRYVKDMLQAGLGVPSVEQLINLHDHGVGPGFAASMVKSGLVDDLDFSNVIRLRENDARGEDMGRIRSLGFGPFSTGDVIKLRQNAVAAPTFEALKEAGFGRAGAADAISFRQNDVTADRIRDMKRQGFHDMSLEQIIKLRRTGII